MENRNQSCEQATLYYDGQCPLCTREMARLAALKEDGLRLQDIHQIDDYRGLPDRDTLLRNLHLKTADGELLTGVDANVMAWQGTPYSRLFAWMRWPLVKPVADTLYRWWALWRYRRLYRKKGQSSETQQ
jgi:predicted DCC family thiol-disulfide oxidoreductase YuxK